MVIAIITIHVMNSKQKVEANKDTSKSKKTTEQLDYLHSVTQKELLYDVAQLLFWIKEEIVQIKLTLNDGNTKT